jgi:hypothetical protein
MKKIVKCAGLTAIVAASFFGVKKADDAIMKNYHYEPLYQRTLLLYGDKDGDGHLSDAEKKQFPKDVFSYGNSHINPENMTYRKKIRKLKEYNNKKEQELKDAKELKNNYELKK